MIQTNEGIDWRLTIDDVSLSCFYPRGLLVEEEVTCNSQFMLETTPTIGTQIHQQMLWIPMETSIYLIMDNTGGHETIAARNEYTWGLRNEYNIIIKFQPPHSPEVNALDLGYFQETHWEYLFIAASFLEIHWKRGWSDWDLETWDRMTGSRGIGVERIGPKNNGYSWETYHTTSWTAGKAVGATVGFYGMVCNYYWEDYSQEKCIWSLWR